MKHSPQKKNIGSLRFFCQTCFQKQGRCPVDGRQRNIDVDTTWMVSIGHLNWTCDDQNPWYRTGFIGNLSPKKLIKGWMIVKVDIFWMWSMNLYIHCSNIVRSDAITSSFYDLLLWLPLLRWPSSLCCIAVEEALRDDTLERTLRILCDSTTPRPPLEASSYISMWADWEVSRLHNAQAWKNLVIDGVQAFNSQRFRNSESFQHLLILRPVRFIHGTGF